MKQQTNSEKVRVNKPSSLLSRDENDLVFSLLGQKCHTMCTAVIQLYTTEGPAHSSWKKMLNGVACFVRDPIKRSYFIRIYCLAKHTLFWEEEMYDSIIINKSRDFLICFEGQDCMVALSFAADVEANLFYKVVTTTTSNRSRRHRDRQSRKNQPGETMQSNGVEDGGVVLRNAPNAPVASPFAQMPQASAFAGPIGMGNGRDKRRANRKLTKADISMPTDFKHIVHVGWSAQKGYDLNNEEVSTLNAFLEKAGVSEQQLNDRDTRAYIYDFIQSNNVLDSVKSEKEQREPPPVPSRNNNVQQQRIAPPPPPAPVATRPPAQLPASKPRANPPSRPPPISDHVFQNQNSSSNTVAQATPPPPPPPMPPAFVAPAQPDKPVPSSLPVVNDTRNALMESIRKGTTLKKVDSAALSTGSGSDDGRNNLLKEIRQGVELRPAGERELSQRESGNSAGRGTDALADALKRALQERNRALRWSDEEEDSSDNDEWDD